MLKEFRDFAIRGNVIDLAVGIIIGAAFTTIVTSLVNDVLMPPLGVIMGGVDFSGYYLQLTHRDQTFPSLAAAKQAGAAVVSYGNFINAVINFLIVAFALFMIIRQVNKLQKIMAKEQAEAPAAAPSAEVTLLGEIRDLLKSRQPG